MIHAKHIHHIRGGVTVRDYRGTGLCPPVLYGGRPIRIRPLIYVEHIPVIRNVKGVADLLTLGRVLKDQGLNVHNGTDREGNVALFTYMTQLCYHARGSNSVSMGTEHMHFGVDEFWSERQMRAAAWLAWHAWHDHGIPLQHAVLNYGRPTPVRRRGFISHKAQAHFAEYNDRSDPGRGFVFKHMWELTRFYNRHRHF